MNHSVLPRRLWYANVREHVSVDQGLLQSDLRPLIVLGEAGMGKSTLLEQLRGVDGYEVCTARKLINAPDPTVLLNNARTLVIDALDEVSAQRDGDAVDLVLRKLAVLGNPRFILSCRVADWRSATALQGIADFYERSPLELHLEPLDRDDATTFLGMTLGKVRAEDAIGHLESLGLSGLWSNPQTLELVERVARVDKLPSSKGDLFTEATKLLRTEHREEKAGTSLAAMAEAEVLDAAGAAFAALILSGKDALSRLTNPDADDLQLREVATLLRASSVGDILDARLFAARDKDRFTYAHRAIGEFLGARWLARNADTPRKQRRLLELFSDHALVPASLRGIHAWLVWHSPALAGAVIAADPMGLIEYGDADDLTPVEGRALFEALRTLSRDNPRFRDWTEYRVGGLIQATLLPEIRETLTAPETEFGLRLLVLQALKGSSLLPELSDALLNLLLDSAAVFANRREAGERLTTLAPAFDWPAIIRQLRAQDDEDGVRLAIELMNQVGYERFDDALVLDVAVAQLKRAERTVGIFFALVRKLPADRLDPLLDGLTMAAVRMDDRNEGRRSSAVTDLAFGLIARRLECGGVAANQLWSWLESLDSHVGYDSQPREAVAERLAGDDPLRQAVQRYILFDQPGDKTVWQRSWRMTERSSGLRLNESDVILLLNLLDPPDPRWRDLIQLISHSPELGGAARAAAEKFVADAEDAEWLTELPTPRPPEWQVEQERRQRRQHKKREREWETHRAGYTERIDALRAGDYGALVNPAKAYLKLFYDSGKEVKDGPARLEEWLGSTLRDACLTGFENYLIAYPPYPTATDIAQSYAEDRRWEASYIVVAALAERLRTGRGFDDLSSERLMVGLFELRKTRIHDYAGIGDLDGVLAAALRKRGEWEAVQRLYFEPQFAARRAHVDGLYSWGREPQDAELAAVLAADWLDRFPDMAHEPEAELIDLLLTMPAGRETLRGLLPLRRPSEGMGDERQRNWQAVGLIVDCEATSTGLDAAGPIEPKLLWHIRARLGDRRYQGPAARLDDRQLQWMIDAFRAHFPAVRRPDTVTTGDTNPWDAADYMGALINRLADNVSDFAIAALTKLRDAPQDGYSAPLRIAES